jgi:hypothetical protein
MLSPEELQPPPMPLANGSPLHGEVAFNSCSPYGRVPWISGIMGCSLKVSTIAQTVWTEPYLGDGWHELENQGFAPRLEWLDRLLEFSRYVVDRYYPAQCIPSLDQSARGPGDLVTQVLGAERSYFALYDHPREMSLLIDQITDLYIHWARAQHDVIPQVAGGYCNQYGIWCPGTCLRTQHDTAINLSPRLLDEFFTPSAAKVVEAFDYQVFHTHSATPHLAESLLGIDKLTALDVTIDPGGPSLEELIPFWNRILERKSLIIQAPVTQQQLDMLVSSLSPGGLWLDVEIVTEDELASWDWSWTKTE